jgi:hypothetical protein
MVPCKECLVKSICIAKLRANETLAVTQLNCIILNSWLIDAIEPEHGEDQFDAFINETYKELRTKR